MCCSSLSALNRHVHTITFPNLQTLGFLFGDHAMGHKVGTEGGWGREEEAQSVKREKKSSADVSESVLGSISSFQRPFSSPGGLWRIPHDPG